MAHRHVVIQTPSTSHKTCFKTGQKYTQCCHEQHNLLNIFTAKEANGKARLAEIAFLRGRQ